MATRRTALATTAMALFGRAVVAAQAATPLAVHARADQSPPTEDRLEWALFRQRFISPDGRVIDTGNQNCSHSEGQGYGMLLAVAHDDQPTFDLLLNWTARTLARPTDSLHAWRYLPGAANPVPDTNNATDGDLMIALALARAAARWGRLDNLQTAAAIGRDVLRLLVREIGPRTLLLPGAYGFDKPEGLIINPSYYVFPALDVLARLAPSPVWARLRQDGVALLTEARFGHWNLPADWLFISRTDLIPAPAPGWPPRFSYDAIRVPLHLMWSGIDAGDMAGSLLRFWADTAPAAPGWVDLNTGETAHYAANAGQRAIAVLATRCCAATASPADSQMPSVREARDYYAAALVLLARLASAEVRTV